MNTKKWTTATGEKIRIKDMTDSHLVNTIRMLDRAHEGRILEGYGVQATMNGDMATFLMDQELASMERSGPSSSFPIYNDLVEEAARRGLMKD